MFKPEELEQFVCGSPELDMVVWEKAARYVDGYTAQSQQISWLWSILQNDLDVEQKQKFVMFCTGCHRAPINGLRDLPIYIGR